MFCQSGFNYFADKFKTSDLNCLEIGIFNGDSIGTLASMFPEKKFYGVDPFIEDGYTSHTSGVQRHERILTQKENAYRNIQGKPNATIFEETSGSFAARLTDEMVKELNVGWVLIDGSHHYADVVIDIKLAMRLIGDKKGGIIFDDVCVPEVGKAYAEFLEEYKGKYGPVVDIYLAEPGHILTHTINQ
ncbi:MAG TPA: class I SAM-dependent methyltransferase [Methanosarcina sp.]|nr:class I SAM-dependent methyltransferase [Methanosarcina sp.]